MIWSSKNVSFASSPIPAHITVVVFGCHYFIATVFLLCHAASSLTSDPFPLRGESLLEKVLSLTSHPVNVPGHQTITRHSCGDWCWLGWWQGVQYRSDSYRAIWLHGSDNTAGRNRGAVKWQKVKWELSISWRHKQCVETIFPFKYFQQTNTVWISFISKTCLNDVCFIRRWQGK